MCALLGLAPRTHVQDSINKKRALRGLAPRTFQDSINKKHAVKKIASTVISKLNKEYTGASNTLRNNKGKGFDLFVGEHTEDGSMTPVWCAWVGG